MKRILSVILSLALLASALIIPMSVSAADAEAETSAAQAVIGAVNGLKVDLNAVNPIELAVPVDSRTAVSDSTWSSSTGDSVSTDKIDIADSTDPTVGTKTVKVNADNPVTASAWGLKQGDLHAIKYSVNVPEKMSYVKDIDYIVVYVKTNRSLKMRLCTHNGYSYAGAITDDIQVSAKEGYQPVAISLRDGFAKNKQRLYAKNKSFTQGIYLSIASMTDGENTIADSDITFGSILYVPGDTAARDFKYTIDSNALTVTDRFTTADGVTGEMLIAAEKIENDGRYTANSFANLQSAISAAKKVLIDKNNETEVVGLFKEEVARLYKLEEVFRPKFVETGADEPNKASEEGDISALNLTDYQKNTFGEYVAVATKDNTHVHFVDANANSRYPGDNTYLKTYANYKNLYLAVYNTGNAFETTAFSFLKQFSDGFQLANKENNKFALHNGYYLYSLYSTSVANNRDKFLLDFASTKGITQANRVQVFLNKVIPEGKNVYFGSILGEVAFNVSTDTVIDKASLVNFYTANIANKGYENSAAVEETMELLGITTVQVVKELNNTIGITETLDSAYTLNAAVVGENVSFTLTDKPAGVDVTVKYGDVEIEPDGDVYTITVEKDKKLYIIPSHKVTEGTSANINITTQNNVSKSITPWLYVTKGNSRWDRTASQAANLAMLSDGTTNANDVVITDGNGAQIKFNNGSYYNNYTPGTKFDFNQPSYTAYADLVFDLGRPTDIYKFQHISVSPSNSMGVYQLYASESATNLFSEESLICNYQNMDDSSKISQEIEFPTRTAQYVAVRCYMPIIKGTGGTGYCFRIKELAIYGTPSDTAAYKVTEIKAPTGGVDAPTPVPDGDLLTDKTFESIVAYENGNKKEFGNNATYLDKLNSQTYYSGGHGDFDCYGNFRFYEGGECKNGYSFDRTNTNGNIVFNVPATEPKVYYDFTYDLGDYHKITSFGAYLVSAENRRIQAYEVYIGNDRASLYTGEPVVVYNNYYNTYGQMITFDQAKVGKYIGFRVLNPGTANDDGNTYVRIDELAAYGTKVGEPADENLKAAITSNGVYILDNNNSSVYTGTDGTQRTALRLTVGYKSPKVPGGADASKIILANDAEANVIERNVIAIAKSKYDALENKDLNIHTAVAAGASVTTSTATSTDHPVSNYFKSETIPDDSNYCMAYGALNINNISETNKDSQIVVIGRVVYEYQGEIYAVYSNIVGNETGKEITAQAAYNKLNDPSQGWFN